MVLTCPKNILKLLLLKNVVCDFLCAVAGVIIIGCWFYFSRYPENGIIEMDTVNLRPRARTILKWSELKVGDVVMVNYNVETPEERGFWFDAEITSLREISRTNKEVHAKILLG